MPDEILTEYKERADSFRELKRRFRKRYRKLGMIICGSGAAGLVGLFIVWTNPEWMRFLATTGIILLPFLGAAVIAQRRSAALRNRYRELRRINEDATFRHERNWSAIDFVHTHVPDEKSAIAEDLNLFGRASVFHLLCTAQTAAGIQTLRNWILCQPSVPTIAEITERQQAVRELNEQTAIRQEVSAACRLLRSDRFDADALLEWAEGPLYLAPRTWLKWLIRAVPFVSVSMLTLVLLNVIPQSIGLPVMTVAIIAAVGITVSFMGPVHDIFRTVSPDVGSAALQRLELVFTELARLKGNSSQIAEIRSTAEESCERIHQLKRIMRLSVLSRIPITLIAVYAPLQFLLLWDFQMLNALEVWQQRHSKSLQQWLECLGQYEALAALAGLTHENPDWAFPEFTEAADPQFQAREIGHPLLTTTCRVNNDVHIGRPQYLLMVTGSNMSGKSTLLKTIGINTVLAHAGAPVCAKQLTLPRVSVVTSIRIIDSLDDGVSLFMAEIKRLKAIVDEARSLATDPDLTMLVLLDEILHGTNTSERQIAVQRVLGHLLSHDVIGAVTTHDLHLADDTAIKEACQIVHFRESLSGDGDDVQMTFDYQMRPGIAPTTNAIRLLDMVGL